MKREIVIATAENIVHAWRDWYILRLAYGHLIRMDVATKQRQSTRNQCKK